MCKTKINPTNVVRATLHDFSDAHELFWYTDAVYRKTLLSKEKLRFPAGWVPKSVVSEGDNFTLAYVYNHLKIDVPIPHHMMDRKMIFGYKLKTDCEPDPQKAKLEVCPHVQVFFVDGKNQTFWFDNYEEACQFYENIFSHQTIYTEK